MTARLRLTLAVLAVMAVLLVGAAGYIVIESDRGISAFDAIYMTVITVSTVGFEPVWPLSQSAQMWTIGLIAVGIMTVSYAFTSLVTLVVSEEYRSERERKRMQRTIGQLKNHVVLCGYGRMGAMIASELHRHNLPFVVIDNSEQLSGHLSELEHAYIHGDATEEETLLRAGLVRARALVIALPHDADNVFITLTAHTLCPEMTIVARAEQPSTEAKLRRAGANRVVCPQAAGAMKIANILTRPAVVDFVELANKGVDLEIDEYVIARSSPLVGKTLRESAVREATGAIVVAIKRSDGEAIVDPDPDAVLCMDDTLILVGRTGVSERLGAIGS